jgi:hypothetical protein
MVSSEVTQVPEIDSDGTDSYGAAPSFGTRALEWLAASFGFVEEKSTPSAPSMWCDVTYNKATVVRSIPHREVVERELRLQSSTGSASPRPKLIRTNSSLGNTAKK